MTITMVSVLSQIRKNPGISKEQVAKNLKMTPEEVALAIKGLQLKHLITLNAKQECLPIAEPA